MKINKCYCKKKFDGTFGTFHSSRIYEMTEEEDCFYVKLYKNDMEPDLYRVFPGQRFYKKGCSPRSIKPSEFFDDYFTYQPFLRKEKLKKLDEKWG